jgi:hypothetical protein
MTIIDNSEGKLQEIEAFAKETNRLENFKSNLQRLKEIAENRDADVYLYKDFAPLSLYFAISKHNGRETVLNGGLIFHGQHDGYGSGSAPSFSVTLTPTDGWAIHT